MTVQCPRCRTQYKIPTARINDPRPVFKCTRCSLVFSSEPDRGARTGKAKEDKNLTLPFSSRKEPSRAKPAAVDEDAPTIRSARDAEAEEDESELLEEAEEAESEEDETEEDETEEEDTDEAESDDAEEEEESADDEDEAEEEEEDAEPEEPVKPARRPRRTRAADEDDAAEPAFARAERERAAERERERVAAEKERAAAEKERERARIAAEKERPAAEKEREAPRAAAEKEKERARAAAEKERARAAEARRREREELRLREEEEEIENEGPDDLGDDDDDEPKRPVLRASESKQRRAPINPRRIRSAASSTPSKSPLKTVTIGVAAVVVAYVLAALWLGSSSEAAIATLSRVPVLGSLLGGDHLLVWRLQLTDVDGGLDQIKGGRPAYVVSGRAVNTSNEDLRVIEIEGRLLVNGVEQRRQTVYAANQQRKTIQDLSPSEVEMLLRLEPNRRFSIRPGESASFLLVFPNPPPGTTEVTCRVLDARNS